MGRYPSSVERIWPLADEAMANTPRGGLITERVIEAEHIDAPGHTRFIQADGPFQQYERTGARGAEAGVRWWAAACARSPPGSVPGTATGQLQGNLRSPGILIFEAYKP